MCFVRRTGYRECEVTVVCYVIRSSLVYIYGRFGEKLVLQSVAEKSTLK